jgi:hypothetical protein
VLQVPEKDGCHYPGIDKEGACIASEIKVDENGMTELMWMSFNGDISGVQKHLHHCADPMEMDCQGLTALHYAIFRNQ